MNSLPQSLHIAVLRGGPATTYDLSLKTGAHVLKNISLTHTPLDVLISKDGTWHVNGIERTPERILRQVDVAFNALHGLHRMEKSVEEFLHHYSVPHTGPSRYASAISGNHYIAREHLEKEGVDMPAYGIVREEQDVFSRIREILSVVSFPLVVRPISLASSETITLCKTPDALSQAIEVGIKKDGSVIVEEYIAGKSVVCGVINNFRDSPVYTLPPSEVMDNNESVCPSHLKDTIKKQVEDLSKHVHQALNLGPYSQSHFVVHPKKGVYFLHVNTLPTLTSDSIFSKSLEVVGVSQKQFIDHVLALALQAK